MDEGSRRVGEGCNFGRNRGLFRLGRGWWQSCPESDPVQTQDRVASLIGIRCGKIPLGGGNFGRNRWQPWTGIRTRTGFVFSPGGILFCILILLLHTGSKPRIMSCSRLLSVKRKCPDLFPTRSPAPIFLRPRVCQTSAFESDNLFFGS